MKLTRKNGDGANALNQALTKLGGFEARVGWFKSAVYPKEPGSSGDAPSVAKVAQWQEYGVPERGIPARPFFRNAINENKDKWINIIQSSAKETLAGTSVSATFLDKVSFVAQADVKQSIKKLTEPPLAESTIKARLRKRSNKKSVGLLTKPLVDTGYMLATVDREVIKR